MMTKKEERAATVVRYTEQLRELFPPASRAFTVLDHVSRSGMMRHIRVLAIVDGEPYDVTGWIAVLFDYRTATRGGLKVSGCGMDMGFSVVYELARGLYPQGFDCPGEKCRSNDHSNGDRDYTPHRHSDGGYAIEQRWI